jgi:cysteine desulfurase
LILGGGQEGGMRSGTENVPGIAAFGEAVKVGYMSLNDRYFKMKDLREYAINRIESELSEISITNPESAAPHILNITLPKIKSETMLHYLSSLGIFVSSGSACSSNGGHFSSALTAFGRSDAEADTSIRISLSHKNEKEDIDALIDGLKSGLAKLSRMR